MRVKISGSSGYLGTLISEVLKNNGHRPEGIRRELLYGPVTTLANEVEGSEAVIHLAGAPILRRWTKKNKEEIINSRSQTAQNLAQAIKSLKAENRPRKVISASGISIFKPGSTHTENSTGYDTGFLGKVVKQWEQAWKDLPSEVELTIFRTAVVLGKASPTMKTMLFPFKMGVGGKIGNGKQPFPFIHEKDVAMAYKWALENSLTGGMYILAAPEQVSNKLFTHALAKSLNRPAFMKVPGIALQLLYGEAAMMLTSSPAVYPEKLTSSGFQFNYPTLEQTLKEIFK